MRFARIVLGLLLALAGLLVTIAGAAAAFWLVGPDDTIDTGEQQLSSKGLAVMTAPDLLDRHGPKLSVTASAGKPVFVGVGQDLDVASYLGTSAYTRVVRLNVPPKFDTQEMKGGLTTLNPPGGLDWWTVKAAGQGKQSVSWPMADGSYDVVAMNADGSPGVDVRLTLGMRLPGLFGTCLVVFGAGIVLLVLGLLLMLVRRRQPPAPVVPPVPQYQPPAYQPTGSWASGPQGLVRRAAAGATGIALLLVATGCVAVPERNTSHAVTRAAVTMADGQTVVKRYNEVNNKANQNRDAKLSETIEGDPTLAQTRAGYQIGRKIDEAGKDKIKPFMYTRPQIGAPQFSAYPMRFVVSSGVSDDPGSHQLGVWQRQNAGVPWVLTNSVYPDATTKLPPMDGLRTPTKADMGKLSSLPQSAGNDLALYLSGGTASPKAGLFVPSPETVTLLTDRAKDKAAAVKEAYISTVTDTFRLAGDPVTFISSSGEGLVFLALSEQYLQRIEPGSNAYWTSGPPTAFSNYVKYTQTLHQDHLFQAALVIPQKGHGKIRILSVDGQLVGAGGS
jgi:hypothetical protein